MNRFISGRATVPIVTAFAVGTALWYLHAMIDPRGWVAMIAAWLAMASALTLVLWSVDRALFGVTGAAGQLYEALCAFLGARREAAT